MGRPISHEVMSKLCDFVDAQMGWHFPQERWDDLQRGIDAAAKELNFDDAQSCIQWLVSTRLTPQQIAVVAGHFTVGETYFRREPRTFDAFQTHILPGLIGARLGHDQRIRIWSAGCCTGEEPYSIAIGVDQTLPDGRGWDVSILATDIDCRFLRKAAEGVYSDWSFRGTSGQFRAANFRPTTDGRFQVQTRLRQMVTFSYLNLAEDVFPSALNNTAAMDVIFCRNVMIYMGSRQVDRLTARLMECLVEGGWLILGASETFPRVVENLRCVTLPGATVYQKVSSPTVLGLPPGGDGKPPTREPAVPTANFADCRRDIHAAGVVEAGSDQRISVNRSAEDAAGLVAAGRSAEAYRLLTRLISSGPQPSGVLTLMARACANEGQLREAIEWCDKAIAVDKLDKHAHYLRAQILQDQGARRESAEALRRALFLDPEFVMAHVAMGHLAWRQSGPSEARKHFDAARTLLSGVETDTVLPDSEGLTAGRLIELISAVAGKEPG